MTRRRVIEVDDDVYRYLEKAAAAIPGGTPNDVLRQAVLSERVRSGPGALMPLVEAGLLKHGDVLVCIRPRLNEILRAVVTANGRIRLEDGREFLAPGPALTAATPRGTNSDGWKGWTVQQAGRTLASYRSDLAAADFPAEPASRRAASSESRRRRPGRAIPASRPATPGKRPGT